MVEALKIYFVLHGQDHSQEKHESSYISQTMLEAYEGGLCKLLLTSVYGYVKLKNPHLFAFNAL